MKRFIPRLAGLLLFLSAAPSVWACPECRVQVNSGVYSQNFTGTTIGHAAADHRAGAHRRRHLLRGRHQSKTPRKGK